MENLPSTIERKRLQKSVIEAFREEIKTLPTELQYILIDDLITAFQNRMTVFQRIQAKTTP